MSQTKTHQNLEPVHVMVDIETLDTIPSAVILSIGACIAPFNSYRSPLFYTEISISSQKDRTQSYDTRIWWAAQGNCPDQGTTELADALLQFNDYLDSFKTRPIIWCKGTDFDIAILSHAYREVGTSIPWKYNDVRDFRTIKKMFEESIDTNIVNDDSHNALEDAIFQARQLHSIKLALK